MFEIVQKRKNRTKYRLGIHVSA